MAHEQKKNILITGVTKGIGLAMTSWFAKNGHSVYGCGRNVDAIRKLNESEWASKSNFQSVDTSSAKGVQDWIKVVIEKAGSLDLVINNAAISGKPGPLWEISVEDFDKLIDINIKGINYVIHSVLPHMLEANKGVIINLSSGWGRSTAAGMAPYCCSKWAIEGLSLALAKDLPSPLACAPLNPGMINTEMLEGIFSEDASMSRTPEQWIQTAGPFLLSLDRSCNGQRLTAP
ncbi:uncharacterized protein [Clytia hemisphaerica]|uniref:Oxidoreductase n=1 Tax=Clytia hemisphaerica TaxID=252671 RepID=A0A7M6DMS9_9CNID|eukprot:TCONS_00003994-protein